MADAAPDTDLEAVWHIPMGTTITTGPDLVWVNFQSNGWNNSLGEKRLAQSGEFQTIKEDLTLLLNMSMQNPNSYADDEEACASNRKEMSDLITQYNRECMANGAYKSSTDVPGPIVDFASRNSRIVLTDRHYNFIPTSPEEAFAPKLYTVHRTQPSRVTLTRSLTGRTPGPHITYHTQSTVTDGVGNLRRLTKFDKAAISRAVRERWNELAKDPNTSEILPVTEVITQEREDKLRRMLDVKHDTEVYWNPLLLNTEEYEGEEHNASTCPDVQLESEGKPILSIVYTDD